MTNEFEALLNWEPSEEVQEVLRASRKADPLTKPHDWRFVRVLRNDTKLWQCSKCGSESWTLCNNEGPHVCRPPTIVCTDKGCIKFPDPACQCEGQIDNSKVLPDVMES